MQAILIAALALAPGQPQGAATGWPPPYDPGAPPRGSGGSPPPSQSENAGPTVEQRKEIRDAVLLVIPDANAFMKKFGDQGISALAKCTPATGRKIVALYAAGKFQTLSSPHGVVSVIHRHGEPAAVWALANFDRLLDVDVMKAWEQSPMEYVYDLRDLNHQAELNAAHRKYARDRPEDEGPSAFSQLKGASAMLFGVFLVVVAFFWRARQG
jgi:hypothetical protein